MKLCKLKLKNLNSFRKEIDLDFEKSPLDDASLVAITGPTGAGKTTLLDAICVALYGKTPRLSGTTSQHPRHLISHGEKEGFAEVHFIANETRYVAIWSLRRGNPAEVRLSYAEDNKVISDKLSSKGKALGSSQRTVSEEVESILGLDFDAFRRSVMLAQGEFAAFLKADKEDRRTILEATAGISIYDVLKDKLNEKVAEVEKATADVLDKLNKIPETSQAQLTEAEVELDRLESEVKVLDTQSQRIQQEKNRETKRKEDFGELQSSEKRQGELLYLQPEIDTFQVELENAQRAKDLRSEKREYDTAKLDLEKAEEALDTATTGKTDAEEQVNADKADFDEKEKVYQAASTEHTKKTEIYNSAKLDVKRASDQFAEAANRTPKLTDLDNQIKVLSDELTSKETEQTNLQKQINEAQTFLDKNPLPSDRQHRFNQANALLAQLDSQQKQLETALTSEVEHGKKVSSQEREIGKLSKTHAERLSEKTNVEAILKKADAELSRLQSVGTQDKWNARKQQAGEAQPIAQEYETAKDNLADSKDRLRELNKKKAELDADLEQIDGKLSAQEKGCQCAEETVQRCENEVESARLINPINQLRQRLQSGEPCSVCGATHHPRAHDIEPEGNEMLQNAEDALERAKTELQTAQNQRQYLQKKQVQLQQDKQNVTSQINDCTDEIEILRNEMAEHLEEWQEIYPNDGVSSEWVAKQMEKVDTAIASLGEAEQVRTEASHAYDMASQQFKTCETEIEREKKSLNEVKVQWQNASNAIVDLQADIASTEERFWEFLPVAFHGVTPQTAKDQFNEKIAKVETCENKLGSTEIQLKLINAKIETDQDNLETVQKNRDNLQAEIDTYRSEGEKFLDTVREKTDGLETEDKIDTTIEALEVDRQAKKNERDGAEQQLQRSQQLLTQNQTTHGHCEEQYEKSTEKFKTARDTYFEQLSDAGFDSPEAHDNAFQDDAQMQELTDQIDAHEDEKQALELVITELRTRFEETPFDPEALERITAQVEEIDAQFQAKREKIGAQGEVIKGLKIALQKRESLADELRKAEQEMERWQRLQEIIPRNDLRDFALEIMFRQMGRLANVQLSYLTSERYQLKVEGIGDLTVIDRWNANEERPVETLSGGESFLTSLALALALADLSRGRAQLNSLFLDEGFGTLDTETLDIAIAALEGLRMQGRSIFLISHIQELTRRLPVKINVRKRGDGSSSVQVQG